MTTVGGIQRSLRVATCVVAGWAALVVMGGWAHAGAAVPLIRCSDLGGVARGAHVPNGVLFPRYRSAVRGRRGPFRYVVRPLRIEVANGTRFGSPVDISVSGADGRKVAVVPASRVLARRFGVGATRFRIAPCTSSPTGAHELFLELWSEEEQTVFFTIVRDRHESVHEYPVDTTFGS